MPGVRFRAAVLRAAGAPRPYARSRPLALETVDVPPPASGEVLVAIRAASFCHSDLSVVNGDRAWPLPIVPGHEAAGIVVEVGDGVVSVERGDGVALVFLTRCGLCERCVEGKPFLCERGTAANRQGRLLTGGPRLRLDGEPVHHHMGLSAFAEYALVSEKSLVKLPAGVPFVEASLFGCAVMCGAGTALYTAGIRPGQSVAVIGLGGVGLAAVMGAVLAGAARIVAVDPGADKRDLALSLGATDAVSAADPRAVEAIRDLTSGGVDHAIEAAGTAEALETAFRATRRGGSTVTVGLPHASRQLTVSIAQLTAEARTLKGSYVGSCVPSRDVPAFLALWRRGQLPVDRLVSRTIALDHINDALDALADGAVVRQVITFDHD